MKLATFRREGSSAIGLVHSGATSLFDHRRRGAPGRGRDRAFASMLALIDADDAGLDAARALFAKRGGEADLSLALADGRTAGAAAASRARCAMHVLRHAYPPVGARRAGAGARATGGEAAFHAVMAEPLGELAPIYRSCRSITSPTA